MDMPGDDALGDDDRSMALVLKTRAEGRRAVVWVEGELDIRAAPQLREALAELVHAGHHHLILDFERVGFLDSSGLSVLVGALNRLRPHEGTVRLVCSQEPILKILRLTGLNRVFPIHADLSDALGASEAPPESLAIVL